MRRPQRPHDVTLFDPMLRHRQHGRVVSFGPEDEMRHTTGNGSKSQSQRSSFIFKDKSGEKLMKRALVSEGLGR